MQVELLNLVLASRLLCIAHHARFEPYIQLRNAVFSVSEWRALWATIHHLSRPPDQPPDLQTAIRWIARLGGHLERKGVGAPGVKTLWRGFRSLHDLATMWEILH